MTGADNNAAAAGQRAARRWGLDISAIEDLGGVLDRARATYARVEALAEMFPVAKPAQPAWRVERVGGSDPHGAWMYRTEMPAGTAPTGPLAGQRLVVKDAIAVAGVPMTLGGNFLVDFVPSTSALVVERALAAGATLAGTAVCEDLCYSGSSFTSVTGPVRNPYDPLRAAGGSTSGCAVLLATGEADLAFGTDLGGSVRNPAAWCGISALKPSFGVVPYSGAVSTEFSMDHLGLMARTARDIALLLDVVAGASDADPRQAGIGALAGSAGGADSDISHLRVGILRDGFGWPERSDPRVDAMVREAAVALGRLGAGAAEVSVALYRHATDIHVPISCEGGLATVFEQNTQGSNRHGSFDAELAWAFGQALGTNAANLPLNGKIALIAGTVLRDATKSRTLALAQRLRVLLRAQIDAALRLFDVLVLPAVPMLPHLLPTTALPAAAHQKLAFEMHDNNCAANLTGHPALSVPCGLIDGLPVGMLLLGRHLEDHLLLAVAHQFQQRVFATPSPPARRRHA